MDEVDICKRCNKRECENFDGEYEMYCSDCNDRLADSYREQQEFNHYHSED